MKKPLAISVAMNLALMIGLGLSWKALTAHAATGKGGAVPARNGDVNGDGKLDIADAIFIINNQFRGGPLPVPIPSELPATGQKLCHNRDGNVIDCESQDFPGQDASYQSGCPIAGRFKDNGDGTITDNCTGLMWQKDTADVNPDGKINDADRLSWQDALKYCESLSFAGQADWRLPNIRELQSIVDYGRVTPSIDQLFGAQPGSWYWSSTFYAGGVDNVWGVDFSSGGGFTNSTTGGPCLVRAVRNAQ